MFKRILFSVAIYLALSGCETGPLQESSFVQPLQPRPSASAPIKTECEKAREAITADVLANCLGASENCVVALENSDQRTKMLVAANETCLKEASGTLEADVKTIKTIQP